jgi:hypothetical protein
MDNLGSWNSPVWIRLGSDADVQVTYCTDGPFAGNWRVRLADEEGRELGTLYLDPQPANDLAMGLVTNVFSGPSDAF